MENFLSTQTLASDHEQVISRFRKASRSIIHAQRFDTSKFAHYPPLLSVFDSCLMRKLLPITQVLKVLASKLAPVR